MADIDLLGTAVRDDLGDHTRWFEPDGYSSVALCLIDSIYSTGNRYAGVIDAVRKYRERRGINASADDTASDLVAAVKSWGGADALADTTKHWRCWPSTDAPFKADAVVRAAAILAAHRIETIDDVQERLGTPEQQDESPVKKEWLRIPGQRSGLTWTYFLMLAGVPGVKADRMVVRYVSRVLQRDVHPREAARLVSEVATRRNLSRLKLDHAIWRFESGREVYIDAERPDHLPSQAQTR
ncbi:hypothetical protein [Flexivirga sp. B27]